MAESTVSKGKCIRCDKDRSAVRCEGCLQLFCFNHLNDHRQELSQQFDEIEINRDIFRQNLTEQTNDTDKNPFIIQINQWEQQSIEIIQQTANQCRQLISQHKDDYISNIELNLTKLTNNLKEARYENEFNEIDLSQWKIKLNQLIEQMEKPSNISVHITSLPLIHKINVTFQHQIHVDENTKWKQNGLTIAGGQQYGCQLDQLSDPHGIYVDDHNQCIYIADYSNHRIVRWIFGEQSGEIVAGGNGKGDRLDQLNGPRDVFLDQQTNSILITDYGNRRVVRWSCNNAKHGKIIISNIACWGITMNSIREIFISDVNNNEIRKWNENHTNGTIVAGGNGKGNQLNQFDYPTYICVDKDDSLYISDSENHRVIKWMKGAKEGVIVAGGHSDGNKLNQLDDAEGIFVDHLSTVYVADSRNHRIMRWDKDSKQGILIVGGNDSGIKSNQFRNLRGLVMDQHSNIYVADKNNHRIQRFDIISN